MKKHSKNEEAEEYTDSTAEYDDGNIPEIDEDMISIAPLPESSRPRQDGPGGN